MVSTCDRPATVNETIPKPMPTAIDQSSMLATILMAILP
jgi:hypothetical protein